MRIVNTNDIEELEWSSPSGKFKGAGKQVSEALGRVPRSTDLMERHPFDVEIARLPPGAMPCPYHSHSAQWEFFHVISDGKGRMMGYAPQIKVRDRWAIVAYIRALMRSQNATLPDVPESLRGELNP